MGVCHATVRHTIHELRVTLTCDLCSSSLTVRPNVKLIILKHTLVEVTIREVESTDVKVPIDSESIESGPVFEIKLCFLWLRSFFNGTLTDLTC